jgi:hypothetical protein
LWEVCESRSARLEFQFPVLAQDRPEALQTAISFSDLGRVYGIQQRLLLIPAKLLALETSCWDMTPHDVPAGERLTSRHRGHRPDFSKINDERSMRRILETMSGVTSGWKEVRIFGNREWISNTNTSYNQQIVRIDGLEPCC